MGKGTKIVAVLCLVGLTSVTLAGCSESKPAKTESTSSSKVGSAKPYYQKMLEKGLDAVATDDTNKAQSYFENAVDANGKSQRAKTYLAQVKALNQATTAYKDGDYTTAKAELEKAPKNKDASSALTTKLQQLSDKIGKAESVASSSQDVSSESSSQVSSSSNTKTTAADHKQANAIRNILALNQDLSSSVLKSIPDSVIIAAAQPSMATNADIARAAETLVKQYPELK
ncbi:hypothetical protein [Levilactobacillus spicheri]|uniref:Lipoprotein n=2 Tax=Levilactobacillus spicheri TaxID=216463 RepID=A0ABQ0WVQ5_9LACO|nr:hypothetical protein [Levilactobacillus spicheri]GEO66951.1 hypothetical protein LSP04_13700 [Levilactobacillus spicheri]